MRLVRRALAAGWPVSMRRKRKVCAEAEAILDDPEMSARTKLGACKVLIAADLVNVKLLGIASGERNTDVRATVDALRAALTSQAARDALAALTTSQPIVEAPVQPQPEPPGVKE